MNILIRELSQRLEIKQDGETIVLDTGRFWTQAQIDAKHPGAYMVSVTEVTTEDGVEIREVLQDGSRVA